MQFTFLKEQHIQVKNLRRTISFYQDVLGFRTDSYIKEKHAIFVVGQSRLVCHMAKGLQQDLTQNRQLDYPNNHLVIESQDGEYEKNKAEMAYHEVEILEEVERDSGIRAFFVQDPDGHLIEIIEYGMWEN